MRFNDECYMFGDAYYTKQQAIDDCSSKGSSLVSVMSQAENDFLISKCTHSSFI